MEHEDDEQRVWLAAEVWTIITSLQDLISKQSTASYDFKLLWWKKKKKKCTAIRQRGWTVCRLLLFPDEGRKVQPSLADDNAADQEAAKQAEQLQSGHP